jgi:uncharacterized repeat protein (TIGR04076 family)
MALDPGLGYKVEGTVIAAKGCCGAGHRQGDVFDISYHNTCGLCGGFYHAIFPSLSTFQFGGTLPWSGGDEMFVSCPDPKNTVTLKLVRTKR